ncbi:MAG TPA: hypothetical protein VFM55_05970 [Micromonosporaceae bacterium]|nr:hypothetical protein [Micromonosporaceae bacterium]
MTDEPAAGYAARVAVEIDRLFVGAMAAGREGGGRELVARHGPGAGGLLVEFRTALAWPGRGVRPEGFAAVLRYRELAQARRGVAAQAAHGWLAVDADGTFSATERGHAFLRDLYALHAEVTGRLWPGVPGQLVARVGRVLAAAVDAGPGPALHAMAPPYEPAGAPPGLLLLNRLGTLRYHRADAHATAWAAAGQTATGIQAMAPGPARDAVEEETNARAAAPYAALTAPERRDLLDDLSALGR